MINFIKKLHLFIRFCIVGAGNTIIDFAVFFLLTFMGVPYLISQICSYTVGMLNSYIMNRKWTFQVKKKASVNEMVQFICINLIASGVAFVLIYCFQELIGFTLLVSKVFATAGGTIINFIGSKFFVFKEIEKIEITNIKMK